MKKACIVVDSSSGIKNGTYPDVYVLPLGITAPDGQTFKDEIEITVGQIIANMLEKNIMYKTSQPNPGDAMILFDKLSSEYEEVLVLPLPAALSNAYNTLKMLAADFNNVRVFQQDMIVQLTKWEIEDLLELNKKGELNSGTCQHYLDSVKNKYCAAVIVPDPKFLIAGGRIKGAKATVVKMFNIKVILEINKDGLGFMDKVINIDKAPDRILSNFEDEYGLKLDMIERMCILTSSMADPKFDVKSIATALEHKFNNGKVQVVYGDVPGVIACHTGPNYAIIGLKIK